MVARRSIPIVLGLSLLTVGVVYAANGQTGRALVVMGLAAYLLGIGANFAMGLRVLAVTSALGLLLVVLGLFIGV